MASRANTGNAYAQRNTADVAGDTSATRTKMPENAMASAPIAPIAPAASAPAVGAAGMGCVVVTDLLGGVGTRVPGN